MLEMGRCGRRVLPDLIFRFLLREPLRTGAKQGIIIKKVQNIAPIIRHGKEEYFYGTSRNHFPDPGDP